MNENPVCELKNKFTRSFDHVRRVIEAIKTLPFHHCVQYSIQYTTIFSSILPVFYFLYMYESYMLLILCSHHFLLYYICRNPLMHSVDQKGTDIIKKKNSKRTPLLLYYTQYFHIQ